jgi:hypothetical protein
MKNIFAVLASWRDKKGERVMRKRTAGDFCLGNRRFQLRAESGERTETS